MLIRSEKDASFLERNNLSISEFKKIKEGWLQILVSERDKREKPRLDDKQLTSWNALMLTGYADAYKASQNDNYLKAAVKNANFIKNNLYKSDGSLKHSFKKGESTINGYLEDYAFTIEACIKLYEVTLDLEWLNLALELAHYSIQHFFDSKSGLFYFTSSIDEPLITRNYELSDNVIPASNSVMAHNLFKLSKYFSKNEFLEISEKMLNVMIPKIIDYPQGYSNWLSLQLNFSNDFYEVVIMGPNTRKIGKEINSHYLPNIIIAGSEKQNDNLQLFKQRFKEGEDLIYVCANGTCQLPVKTVKSALELIK